MPPENASAAPAVFVIAIELPEIVVLLIVAADTSEVMWNPPPTASCSTLLGSDAASSALLSVTELLLMVSLEPDTKMPPASTKRPLGPVALARLPWMTDPPIVSGPSRFMIAPPSTSLASVESPEAEPMRLLLTVVFASVSVPQLSIPPPKAPANGQKPVGQTGQKGS